MINIEFPYSATLDTGDTPQQTWIVNIRRTDGTPTVEYVKDQEGKTLEFTGQRMGDKYLIILNSPQIGTTKINMTI